MKVSTSLLSISVALCLALVPMYTTASPKKTNKVTTSTSTKNKAECNTRLSDWQLTQNGINAHTLKYDVLGKKAKISLYELCACPDKTVVVRLKQCKGDEIYTGVKLK